MRLPFASLFAAPWPTVAVEIAPSHVTAVALRPGARASSVRAHAVAPLAAGQVTPSLTSTNIGDVASVGAAVRNVIAEIGVRPRQIGLIVPDAAAKVSLVQFEQVPDRADDLRGLITWQVQKAAPFKIGEAQLTYASAGTAGAFVVAIARRDIVAQYEAACTTAGVQAGVVDLSTLNLVNAVLGSQSSTARGDWLLVHCESSHTTIAIVRGDALVFYRNGQTDGDTELANFVHQSAMYYEDRLGGGGFQRIVVVGATGDGASFDALRNSVEARTGLSVEHIDRPGGVTLAPGDVHPQATMDALASPIGLLLRHSAA